MVTKVWHFLMPNSGAHTVRVENLGGQGQTVWIDHELQTAREALHFTGPDNFLLELKFIGKEGWCLYVGGLRVEDYHPSRRAHGDDSLRELRKKPDGSYLISPGFDANESDFHIIRRFRFAACGNIHEVSLAHEDCIWEVIVDGKLVDRASHKQLSSKMKENESKVSFDLQVANGARLKVAVHMLWQGRSTVWHYRLTVNSVDIPYYWSPGFGDAIADDDPAALCPIILPPDASPAPHGSSVPSDDGSDNDVLCREASDDPPRPESLPQGVSYDFSTASYQASIRNQAGRFVLLGEFRTPEEAYQRYLEAVPKHFPGKTIAPELPQVPS